MGKGGNEELLFNEYSIDSVEDDEKVLEMDSDGCTTMWMYLMSQNCRLKNGYNDKFYVVHISPQLKKIKVEKDPNGTSGWGKEVLCTNSHAHLKSQ